MLVVNEEVEPVTAVLALLTVASVNVIVESKKTAIMLDVWLFISAAAIIPPTLKSIGANVYGLTTLLASSFP